MDKSWMYLARRSSERFMSGVQNFLSFAFERSSVNEAILCPCSHCLNMLYFTRDDVFDHLVCWGFQRDYNEWVYHGEGSTASSSNRMHNEEEGLFEHDMRGLLNDIFQPTSHVESGTEPINISEAEMDSSTFNNDEELENRSKFDDLLKDVEEKVYPNSKYSKLSCLVHLFHLKCLNGWSNKSFSMLLEFLTDLLPEGNLLPKSTYHVKKIMTNLGLYYEKIHSCPNGCMLFWEENEKDEICAFCGASRWKVAEDNLEVEMSQTKKKAAKILRWFPLKPRLQRLFQSSKTANLMKWHHTDRVIDGKLRHPADALSWKHFDQCFPNFSRDPRNVRLALASDGFNPFKTMNVTYSIWPVILIPYNLPPWLVMKQPNFILSLIIPGPGGPGNKIDVYMQPLIKELKELWEDGIETFDSSTKQTFVLKAAIVSTISDFPGYGNLSGWSTKGKLACPSCGFNTNSEWLHHGRKWCYMCHRRWLPADHRWRKDTRSFIGGGEIRNAPVRLQGEEVLRQLEGVEFLIDNAGERWKKKSIFFKLPYWEHLLLRHNLDVMHIEKNVCDNIIGTLLGQKGKSKDNYNARLDLQKMGIRKELHPKKRLRSNTIFLPQACYQMTRAEKDLFLNTLKSIKPPDEYSSNISRCVQLKEKKLIGLKSYDCHMLMQEYLPIALRGTLPDHVSSTVLDLCNFFRIICYKDLTEMDLQFLDSQIPVTLCKLEKIFPPSFFTIMVHLVIHLVEEVRLGGPVVFRWMYPIERDLLTLKNYVHNRAHPEASIAEGYLAQESLTFCSRYLSRVETMFTRPTRNDDEDDQNEIEESNLLCPGRPLGKKLNNEFSSQKRNRSTSHVLDAQSLAQAHRYVLFNVDSVTRFREEHKRLVKNQHRSRRLSMYAIEKIHSQQFSEWFEKRVARMEEQHDQSVTEEIKWLARGPLESVQRFSGYIVKGYRFHTKYREKGRKTQNSGVVVTVRGENNTSSRDRNPTEDVINYYGRLTDIIELNYCSKIRVVLFRCEWVDINRGYKKDDLGATLVNFSYLTHTGANLLDDPFVFASQVDKVFYSKDPKNKDWAVARHIKLRDVFDMGSVDDQAIQNPNESTFDVTHLHRIGDDGDDGEDVTADMELEGTDNEENEDE